MQDGRRLVVLAAALSLMVNLVGITWGIPARWHPDEKADEAAAMVAEGRVLPRSYINPSLPLYVMAPAIAVQQRLAKAGMLSEASADPMLAGRVLAALAGAAAVLALGLWAAPAPSPLAAVLLALAPGFVNLCHFATPEPWLLLATVIVLVGCRRHLSSRLAAATLGVLVGLAGSTKYTAAALLLPALAAAWLGPEAARRPVPPIRAGIVGVAMAVAGAGIAATIPLSERLRLPDARLLHPESAVSFVRGLGVALLLFGLVVVLLATASHGGRAWARRLLSVPAALVIAAAPVGFLFGTPGAAADPLAFLGDLAFNQQTRSEYKGLTGEATSFGAYLALLGDALTWPLLVLAAAGLAVAVARARRRDALAAVWALAALAPYLLVASSGHRALRFLAPVFPPAVLLAAAAAAAVLRPPRTRLLVVGAITARLATSAVLVDRLFLVDSRIRAARWIETHIPPGTAVDVITNHTGYAPEPRGRALRVVPTLSREMAPADRFEEAARAYPETGAPWLVLTAAYYQRFLEHPAQHPVRAQFFRDLLDGRLGFEVAARFRQEGWRRPPAEFVDPEIVVLRRR